jgi:hypothetical protein
MSILNHHGFAERPADALHSSTLNLTLHGHGVNRHADVLGLHETHDADRARLLIHLDFRRLRIEHWGEGHGG